MSEFCEGYIRSPFKELAAEFPQNDVYPFDDFRFEW
jgi:hypothetical protein